jgi:hypothetical protein
MIMALSIFKKILSFAILFGYFFTFTVYAQEVNVDASKLQARVEVYFSPRSGSFEEGSTFQVPVYVNTKGRSINGIEVRLNFDSNKLSIINQTGGVSIIGVWVEPPKYDNTKGTASYVGVIPSGITTGAGLVGTITFKAKSAGLANVSISSTSKILLNDGLGTETLTDFGRANYSILPKAPEGVQIFSETHPVQTDWYNNNTPVVSWIKDDGVDGFSFEFDNKPNTVPDNTIDMTETTKSFEKLSDGLWYFHIKAIKRNIWSTTGHFLLRIDTAPPAEFTPKAEYLVAAVILSERTLVSFFTTDNLSGVNHYEVGVIDKNQPATESPVFVQAESPFQVPLNTGGKLEVIVRAVDHAGNVRDESVAVAIPFVLTRFITTNLVYILLAIILIGLVMLVAHYLFGHHIIRAISRVRQAMSSEEDKEEREEAFKKQWTIEKPKIDPPLPPPPKIPENHENFIDHLN